MLFVSLHNPIQAKQFPFQGSINYDRHMEPKGSLYFPPFVATLKAAEANYLYNDNSRHLKGNVEMEV